MDSTNNVDERRERSRQRHSEQRQNKRKHRRDRSEDSSREKGHRRRRRRDSTVSPGRSDDSRNSRPRNKSDRHHKRSRKRSHTRLHENRPSRSRRRTGSRESRRSRRDRSRTKSSKASGPGVRTPPVGKRSYTDSLGSDTLKLIDLVKALTGNRPEGNKFPMLGNVIPEFDPMVKGQTVQMWLNKVDECARLYSWGDDQVIHYALPKLSGVAKTWYQALPTMSFSWAEWKVKLVESFPCSDDYAELLTEMLSKRVKFNESLELYYYDKINLLNRCEIWGKRAVDCLLYGIEDRSLRLGAKAVNCQEPEQVLKYFQSIKQPPREVERLRMNDRRPNTSSYTNIKPVFSNDLKSKPLSINSSVICYNCNEPGHFSTRCTKKILRCNVCKRLGHESVNCPRLPTELKDKNDKQIEKDVLCIESNNVSDCKYLIQLMINDTPSKGYVDLGSQCTLIRRSEAMRLGIVWSIGRLPVMRGIGHNVITPLGTANVKINIQNIVQHIDIFVVDDSVIKYPTLIGHTFTETPGVVITKTTDALIFTHNSPNKLELRSREDVDIPPKQMMVVPVSSTCGYSGTIYVSGSLRGKPQSEYYLMPGEYSLMDGKGALLIQNVSNRSIILKNDSLVTRCMCTNNCLNVNILNFDEAETIAALNYGPNLKSNEIMQLKDLLKSYETCFSDNLKDLGFTNAVQMEIELTDTQPVVYRPYRLSYPERELVRSMVKEMIDADIICESNASYASPILLVKKKTGERRLCVDYRALNNKTRKEHYPLPLIDDQLDRLAGNNLFISLDLASGYYQIPIAETSQDKTAFVTPDGQYQFKRMPFGLANAPSVFQRAMNNILSSSKVNYIIIYMDDVLIPARTFDEGMTRLKEVLTLLSTAGLTLKLKKCHFFCTELDFLGFRVSGEGISPGSRKTLAISHFPMPQNVHDVRRFLGLTSFFRRFVKNFSIIARPLTDLLRSKFEFKWGDEHTEAFNILKEKLIERPVLALYDAKLETELHTDASKYGVAGILLQRGVDGLLRPVAYYSRKTTADEQRFHSFELETLAVVASLNRFRVYLLGVRFKIVTDCNALRTTLTKRDVIPRISRWWVQFQEYDCEIEYRPGVRMAHVDALSRGPVGEPTEEDEIHVIDVLKVDVQDWIATVQSNDDEIRRIREILQDNDTKHVVEVHNNYQLKDNRVFKTVNDGVRWVVPRGCRWQVLRMNHDDIGHFGFEKTLNRLKSTFWFPKMRRFTKKYVAACLECAHHKTPGGPKEGTLHPIPKLEKPFHTLHADHLGPFVRSKKGNMYLLVIIDAFTKFINIRAVKDTKSVTAIKVFKEHFSYFGVPSRLITDRGTCFTSTKFKDFVAKLKFKHILNAVATPRANGQVERFNRTICDALSTRCHHKNDNLWDEYIGDIQLGINTTVNKTTKKSPSELLFGFRLMNGSESMLSDVINDISDRLSGDDLMQLRSEARERIEKHQEYSKREFDKHRKKATKYKEGDLVRIERTVIDKDHVGKSKKLIPKFQGPYRVLKILDNDRFVVEDTPLTRKGNKKYENIVALDKIHPWVNGYSSDGSESDKSTDAVDE